MRAPPFRLASVSLAVLLSLASGWAVAAGSVVTGRVVGVSDGDTLTVLTPDRRSLKVRLSEIDAPESGQPWGQRSKAELSALTFGRSVRVTDEGRDRYGRTVGRVHAHRLDVNARMVRIGAAWAYTAHLTDPRIKALEVEARAARRGLWSMPKSMVTPPWDWRAAQRQSSRPAAESNVCAKPKRCGELRTCTQARARLRQCGPEGLDGDGDGVPCESLCR